MNLGEALSEIERAELARYAKKRQGEALAHLKKANEQYDTERAERRRLNALIWMEGYMARTGTLNPYLDHS